MALGWELQIGGRGGRQMWGMWGKRGEWGVGGLGGRFSLSSVSRAGGKMGEPRVLNVGQSGEIWGKGGEN